MLRNNVCIVRTIHSVSEIVIESPHEATWTRCLYRGLFCDHCVCCVYGSWSAYMFLFYWGQFWYRVCLLKKLFISPV